MSKILVTGGEGFLGRYVAVRLKTHGHQVFVSRSALVDLRSEHDVHALYDNIKPEIVVHLAAAAGGIGANRATPGRFFYDNLMMGMLLMDIGKQYDIQKFVTMGSVCEYPKHTPVPFKESALWSGYPEETNAPYGIAKKALLTMGQAYRQQYGMNVVHLLMTNLYGPHDNFDLRTGHVVAALVRRIYEAKRDGDSQVVIWGSGTATRDLLYVADAAEAVALATERYDGAEPVNIGTGEEVSIIDLAHLVKKLMGYKGYLVGDLAEPDGQPRRCLDVSRASEFGFWARTKLEDGLRHTIKWYEETCEKSLLAP